MENIKIEKCCFCDATLTKHGNSTWGCWSPADERAGEGEKRRCCDACNQKIVVSNRYDNYQMTGSYDDTSWRF